MENALKFQHLIQKAYTTSRLGVYASDTNIYRNYETAVLNYQKAMEDNAVEIRVLAYNAGKETGKIMNSILGAFYYVQVTENIEMTEAQVMKLYKLSLLLFESTEDNIEKVIEQGNQLFDEMGLKMPNWQGIPDHFHLHIQTIADHLKPVKMLRVHLSCQTNVFHNFLITLFWRLLTIKNQLKITRSLIVSSLKSIAL